MSLMLASPQTSGMKGTPQCCRVSLCSAPVAMLDMFINQQRGAVSVPLGLIRWLLRRSFVSLGGWSSVLGTPIPRCPEHPNSCLYKPPALLLIAGVCSSVCCSYELEVSCPSGIST